MTAATDAPMMLVLHSVRLQGNAQDHAVARRFDLPVDGTRTALASAEQVGHVRHREGRISGWSLTATGRDHAERLLREDLERRGRTRQVEAAYERFMELNAELLAVCTDWQIVRGSGAAGAEQLNDHSDPHYDAAVRDRLERLHRRSVGVTEDLAAALRRFDGYGDRLAAALEKFRSGESQWLTRPTIDSYHSVWFELHEDLLATLGRRRSDTARSSASH